MLCHAFLAPKIRITKFAGVFKDEKPVNALD
jgi:hypothetical protein